MATSSSQSDNTNYFNVNQLHASISVDFLSGRKGSLYLNSYGSCFQLNKLELPPSLFSFQCFYDLLDKWEQHQYLFVWNFLMLVRHFLRLRRDLHGSTKRG